MAVANHKGEPGCLLWHPHCGPCFTEALKVPVVNPVAVPVEGEGACFGSVDVIVEEFFRGPELYQTRIWWMTWWMVCCDLVGLAECWLLVQAVTFLRPWHMLRARMLCLTATPLRFSLVAVRSRICKYMAFACLCNAGHGQVLVKACWGTSTPRWSTPSNPNLCGAVELVFPPYKVQNDGPRALRPSVGAAALMWATFSWFILAILALAYLNCFATQKLSSIPTAGMRMPAWVRVASRRQSMWCRMQSHQSCRGPFKLGANHSGFWYVLFSLPWYGSTLRNVLRRC